VNKPNFEIWKELGIYENIIVLGIKSSYKQSKFIYFQNMVKISKNLTFFQKLFLKFKMLKPLMLEKCHFIPTF